MSDDIICGPFVRRLSVLFLSKERMMPTGLAPYWPTKVRNFIGLVEVSRCRIGLMIYGVGLIR